jgi:selenocysteine-specific elongation factor
LLQDKTLAPGHETLAQLVPDQPVLMVYGDRFVIRDQSAQRTLGGGYVIDPCAPDRGRSRPARIELLHRLDTDDQQAALTALLADNPGGADLQRFAASRNLTEAESAALFGAVSWVRLSDHAAIAQRRWQALTDNILDTLQRWHSAHPDSAGPTIQQLREAGSGSEIFAIFSAVLQQLIRSGAMVRTGAFLRLSGHQPKLSQADQALFERILDYIGPQQLKPPALKDLAALLELERAQLGQSLEDFTRRGLILRISATRFFHPQAVTRFAEICRQLGEQSETGLFDVRGFRDAAQIGRNAAVEILEYFDRSGVTQRIGDRRRLHPEQLRQLHS